MNEMFRRFAHTTAGAVGSPAVFLVQNTQNRDGKAMQLELDELIRAVTEARSSLVDLEDLSDADLERSHIEFQALQRKSRKAHPEQDLATTDVEPTKREGPAAE